MYSRIMHSRIFEGNVALQALQLATTCLHTGTCPRGYCTVPGTGMPEGMTEGKKAVEGYSEVSKRE